MWSPMVPGWMGTEGSSSCGYDVLATSKRGEAAMKVDNMS